MRKRILLMLCMVILTLGMTACGTDPRDVDYNGYSYDDLEKNSNNIWNALQSMDQASMDDYVNYVDSLSEREREVFMEQGAEQSALDPEIQYNLIKSWSAIVSDVGDYKEIESFTITKAGKSTTTELKITFSNRPVVLTYVYNNFDMETEDITIDLVYTVGEKMGKALMNTVMGMGTVFVMLIIISLIISCFGIFPKLEEKRKQKNQPQQEIAAPVMPQASPEIQVQAADNQELIAVIAAAIAASTGQSTDDFVVRSIKRR